MIIHIVRNSDVPYDICKSFVDKLCSLYNGLIIRIIDYDIKDSILNNSTSDNEIYISMRDEDITVSNDGRLLIEIDKSSTADDIIDVIKQQLETFIVQKDICWVKNENGWWYNVDRKHHGGMVNMITCINGKWYCIGSDYYMKTGWVPVELVNNDTFTCFYFDPTDGYLDESKDKSDMPDPFGFSYPPIKVKWY